MLHNLGATRTRVTPTHALIAPDGHVRTALPGWDGGVVVLISPQLGARFTQYLVHMEAGGRGDAAGAGLERFAFVLSGEITLSLEGASHFLLEYGYAYLPPNTPHTFQAEGPCTLNVFERRYVALEGTPEVAIGNEREIEGEPFLGDDALRVRKLLPETPTFDMAVNTMTFEPGATLPFVETHVMEHGLLMLEGGGIYRLGESWYPVTEGDAIFMAPYCPQWFGALGKEPSKYLLYKDAHREPFALEAGS